MSVVSLDEVLELVAADRWDAAAGLLDDGFFELLCTDPDGLRAVYASADPGWFVRFPRQVMSRAFAVASQHPGGVVDDAASAAFTAWVAAQESPATRDVLGVQAVRMGALLASGRFSDAAQVADGVVAIIASAPDSSGFADVLPSLMVRVGTAKLMAGDLDAAVSAYAEGLWWTRIRGEHPIRPFIAGHLALAHALSGRYCTARSVNADPLQWEAWRRLPGALAASLSAVEAGRTDEAEALLNELEDTGAGEWGWMLVHVRARLALLSASAALAAEMLVLVRRFLAEGHMRFPPRSFAGALLRADIADLLQRCGDLRAAVRVLQTPGLWRLTDVLVSAARTELLRGRPENTIRVLRSDGDKHGTWVPARHSPRGAVLWASAEHALTGTVSPSALTASIAALTHDAAVAALTEASDLVREQLLPHLPRDPRPVPAVFGFLARPVLTNRERTMVQMMRDTDATVSDIAAALHVSPATAKTHLQNLYRKLGVNDRDSAVWAIEGPMPLE